jgi:hypothetical protein
MWSSLDLSRDATPKIMVTLETTPVIPVSVFERPTVGVPSHEEILSSSVGVG